MDNENGTPTGTDTDIRKITRERGEVYGHPLINHVRIARRWNSLYNLSLNHIHVARLMVELKSARLEQTPDHQDSLDDVVGYKRCLEEMRAVGKFYGKNPQCFMSLQDKEILALIDFALREHGGSLENGDFLIDLQEKES